MVRQARLGIGLTLLATVAYISLGLPDGLLGVAWPSMRSDFGVPLDSLGGLFVSMTVGYFTSSFFGGRLTAHLRLGTVLALSTLFAGGALVGYAISPQWWMVVIIGIAAGLGGGGIDVALNIYVVNHHGDSMMQWLHATYGIGATVGPVVMTLAIGSLGSWRWGYALVGGLELVLAAAFFLTLSRWEDGAGASDGATAARKDAPENERGGHGQHTPTHDTPMLETLREGRVWLSVLLFFLYMGIEVTLGSWAYTLLTEGRGVSPRLAGFFMASYWGIFTVGRMAAGIYAQRLGQRTIIVGSLLVALIGAVLLSLNPPGLLNLLACALIGVAIAPVLASLLSGTSGRVGARHLGNTIGIQIAAMGAGSAVLPSITGVIARHLSLQAIPPFLAVLTSILIGAYLFSLRTGRETAVTS